MDTTRLFPPHPFRRVLLADGGGAGVGGGAAAATHEAYRDERGDSGDGQRLADNTLGGSNWRRRR
jgi:hypothetical protein